MDDKAAGPGQRVTMNDVAREADCSQTTVSFVLRGENAAHISAKTARRVVEAATTLGYRLQSRSGRKVKGAARPVDKGAADYSAGGDKDSGHVRSRTAFVANDIGMRIIGGIYREGELLPAEADLMHEFKVSRTVLREAIKTLSSKGLLRARSRIGTRVRRRAEWQLFDSDVLRWHAAVGVDSEFLAALGEIRLIFEVEGAALAARHHRREHLPALYHLIDRMGCPDVSRHDFVDADLKLHLEIGRIAGNPFLRALSSLIEVALVAALAKSSPVEEPGGVERSASEHRAVVDAIAGGDEAMARKAMRHVIMEGIRHASVRTDRLG